MGQSREMPQREWTFERISDRHHYSKFKCGENTLDYYLRKYALENDHHRLGSTYVAADETGQVLGYVTLCTSAMRFEDVPSSDLPRRAVPTVLIARLAVDKTAQGRGIGIDLMLQALRIAVDTGRDVGVYAVTVDALNERAKSFYQNCFGFTELLDDPLHLFATIDDLVASGI